MPLLGISPGGLRGLILMKAPHHMEDEIIVHTADPSASVQRKVLRRPRRPQVRATIPKSKSRLCEYFQPGAVSKKAY